MNAPLRPQWPQVRLGEIAGFIRGVTYKPADVSAGSDPAAIACLRTKNIQADLEDDDLIFIPRSHINPDKFVRGGDILVSSANSWNLVGKCCWIPDLQYQATFGGFTSILRVDPKRAFARYIYHWFSTEQTQRLARSFGQQTTNISNLNQARCLDLGLLLPPLDEQRRIAAILDKADALRRKRKCGIKLLNGLAQSIFSDMFGDGSRFEAKPLAEVVDQADRINYGVVQPGDEVDDGVPLVRVSDLRHGRIDYTDMRRISYQISASYSRSVLRGNEILVSCVGSIGEIAIATPAERGFNIARAVARIPISNDLLRMFVAEYLRSPAVERYFTKELRTVSQPTLNIKQISETLIPLPSTATMHEFVSRREKSQVLLQQAMSVTAGVGKLFSSLQSRAFSGQL